MKDVNNHYVYQITNIINGMKYIGKRTCHCDINDDPYMGSGIVLCNAFKKYGKQNFKKEILEICDSEEKAYEREREIISQFNAVKDRNYYNIATGGLGNPKGYVITEEIKRKILQTKAKNNTFPIGEKNGMYGKRNYGRKIVPIISIDSEGNIVNYPSQAEAERIFGYKQKTLNAKVIAQDRSHVLDERFWIKKQEYDKAVDKEKLISQAINEINQIKLRNEKRAQKHSIPIDIIEKQHKRYPELFYVPIYQIDITNAEIIKKFDCIYDASIEFDIDTSRIKRCLSHKSNCAKSGVSFMYETEYNSMTKEQIIKRFTNKTKFVLKGIKKPKNNVPIYCITTKQEFESRSDAIEYFNLNIGSHLADACNGKRKTIGKHPETGQPLKWKNYEGEICSVVEKIDGKFYERRI